MLASLIMHSVTACTISEMPEMLTKYASGYLTLPPKGCSRDLSQRAASGQILKLKSVQP